MSTPPSPPPHMTTSHKQFKGKDKKHSFERSQLESSASVSHSVTLTNHDPDDYYAIEPDQPNPDTPPTTTTTPTPTTTATKLAEENNSRDRHTTTTTPTPATPQAAYHPSNCALCKSCKIADLFYKILPRIAVELENTGSTARDHLANERTWLAYIRTSLAIAGTGVALVQLFTISLNQGRNGRNANSLQRAARPLGAATVLIGVLVLFFGIFRYFHIQKSMMRGFFPVARVTVITISVVISALAAVIFGLLLGLHE